MLATASAQVCVPLGHSSLYFFVETKLYILNFYCAHDIEILAAVEVQQTMVKCKLSQIIERQRIS